MNTSRTNRSRNPIPRHSRPESHRLGAGRTPASLPRVLCSPELAMSLWMMKMRRRRRRRKASRRRRRRRRAEGWEVAAHWRGGGSDAGSLQQCPPVSFNHWAREAHALSQESLAKTAIDFLPQLVQSRGAWGAFSSKEDQAQNGPGQQSCLECHGEAIGLRPSATGKQ